jgi:hypothetical protein
MKLLMENSNLSFLTKFLSIIDIHVTLNRVKYFCGFLVIYKHFTAMRLENLILLTQWRSPCRGDMFIENKITPETFNPFRGEMFMSIINWLKIDKVFKVHEVLKVTEV